MTPTTLLIGATRGVIGTVVKYISVIRKCPMDQVRPRYLTANAKSVTIMRNMVSSPSYQVSPMHLTRRNAARPMDWRSYVQLDGFGPETKCKVKILALS